MSGVGSGLENWSGALLNGDLVIDRTQDMKYRVEKDQDVRNRGTRLSVLCPPHTVTMIETTKKYLISPVITIQLALIA